MMAGMSVLSRGDAQRLRRSAGLELVDGDVNDIDHDGVQLVDVTEPLERGAIAIRQRGHRALERVERRAEGPLAILDRADRAVVAHAPVVAAVARSPSAVDEAGGLQPAHRPADRTAARADGLRDVVDALLAWLADEQPRPEATGDRGKALGGEDARPALDEGSFRVSHDPHALQFGTFSQSRNFSTGVRAEASAAVALAGLVGLVVPVPLALVPLVGRCRHRLCRRARGRAG